ncbi:MAG TPA: hypothetical protein VFZ61_03680 [Polyangiales bacterium]
MAQGYGQLVVGFATFVPNGSQFQTLVDNFGIRSVERLVAGRWRVTLSEKSPGFAPCVVCVENDTTNLHDVRLEAISIANGTFDFVHRTAAFGSLGSLALSDTVDQLIIQVIGRISVGG